MVNTYPRESGSLATITPAVAVVLSGAGAFPWLTYHDMRRCGAVDIESHQSGLTNRSTL